jgi:hypothetical protein
MGRAPLSTAPAYARTEGEESRWQLLEAIVLPTHLADFGPEDEGCGWPTVDSGHRRVEVCLSGEKGPPCFAVTGGHERTISPTAWQKS